MKLKNYFKNITILALVVFVLLLIIQRSCFTPIPPVNPNDTIIKIETRWDTIRLISKVYIPKLDTIIRVDTIKGKVDTLEILKDYFSKCYYVDTINLDTLGFILIKDTITQNKIHSRQTSSNLYIPTITITKTVIENKRELYWGVGLGLTTTQINCLEGNLLYKNKKKQMYSLGIGIDPEFKPVFSGHMFWKFGK